MHMVQGVIDASRGGATPLCPAVEPVLFETLNAINLASQVAHPFGKTRVVYNSEPIDNNYQIPPNTLTTCTLFLVSLGSNLLTSTPSFPTDITSIHNHTHNEVHPHRRCSCSRHWRCSPSRQARHHAQPCSLAHCRVRGLPRRACHPPG